LALKQYFVLANPLRSITTLEGGIIASSQIMDIKKAPEGVIQALGHAHYRLVVRDHGGGSGGAQNAARPRSALPAGGRI
jgi:hypothetical protein